VGPPTIYVFILNVIIEIEAQHRFFLMILKSLELNQINKLGLFIALGSVGLHKSSFNQTPTESSRTFVGYLKTFKCYRNYNLFSLLKFQFHQKSKKVYYTSKIKMFDNVVIISLSLMF